MCRATKLWRSWPYPDLVRRVALLLALSMLAVACTTDSGSLDVIVPPDETGSFPGDLQVGCPHGPTFPFSALENIRPLAEGGSGMVTAAGTFLGSGEGAFWPQDEWMILHSSLREAILVARADEGFMFMTLTRDLGGWKWSGAQGGAPCPLQHMPPSNANTVDWVLDPGAPALTPDSTSVRVLLTEQQCVSGQAIGSRLLGPQVVMTADDVRIAFAARRPPGDAHNCIGNPSMSFVVQLPEPLGDRQVIDGRGLGVSLGDFLD